MSVIGGQGSEGLQVLQGQVSEVVDIMKVNIAKVIDRDAKLEELECASENLREGAARFKTSARRLKTKHWWQNKRWTLGVIVVVVVIVGVIVLIVMAA